MRNPLRTIETDVCVVGAGVLGLAHAFEARRRGLSVLVLERDPRATGASIRGLGHLFFSALASGATLDAAEPARERWLELGRRCGILTEGAGTVIVAHRDQELAVLEAAAAEPGRRARILAPAEIGSLAPIPLRGVLGAFHSPIDLRIDPRAAAARLARLLERDAHARIEWNTPVHGFEPGIAHAQSLRVRAAAVVVCAGAGSLEPSSSGGLRDYRRQLLRVAASGKRYPAVIASGAGVLGYPGFSRQPGAEELRERLEVECPELIERGARLRVAQLPNGDLIVGDTQAYTEHADPFASERADRLLLEEVWALLGTRPVIRQRWQVKGVVGLRSSGEELQIATPCAGVRMVRPVGELAMALCHVGAGELLDELCFGARMSTGLSARSCVTAVEEQDQDMVVRDLRRADGVRAHAEAFGRRASATRPAHPPG